MTNAIRSTCPAATAAPHDLIEVNLPEGFWSYYRALGTAYPFTEVDNNDGTVKVTVNGIDAGFLLAEAMASANDGGEGAPESLDALHALDEAGISDEHLFMMMDESMRQRSLLPEG